MQQISRWDEGRAEDRSRNAERCWGDALWEKLLNTHSTTTNIFTWPLIGQLCHYSVCGNLVVTQRCGLFPCWLLYEARPIRTFYIPILCFRLQHASDFVHSAEGGASVCVRLLACLLFCNYIHCHCSEQQKGLEHIKACGCEGVGEACLPRGQTCPCLSSAFFWGEILPPSKARNRKYHEEEQEERWASPKVDRWKIKRRVEQLRKARPRFYCCTRKQIPLTPRHLTHPPTPTQSNQSKQRELTQGRTPGLNLHRNKGEELEEFKHWDTMQGFCQVPEVNANASPCSQLLGNRGVCKRHALKIKIVFAGVTVTPRYTNKLCARCHGGTGELGRTFFFLFSTGSRVVRLKDVANPAKK